VILLLGFLVKYVLLGIAQLIIGTGQYDTYKCDAPIAKTNFSPEDKETIDTKLNTAKQKCKDRNLTEGTEEFGECVLKLSD
tara:strand:+ start:1727 stop:1969 length:243 start_codon:yes stop_codon:yes gene_type:complete